MPDDATDEAKAEAEADAAKSLNVTVNVTDANVGIRVSVTALDVPEGETVMYTVSLQKAPVADVTVTITISDNGAVQVTNRLRPCVRGERQA